MTGIETSTIGHDQLSHSYPKWEYKINKTKSLLDAIIKSFFAIVFAESLIAKLEY